LAENTDFFLIAEVFALSKYEGFVTIKSYSDFPDRFFKLKYVIINIYGQFKEFLVEDVKLAENVFHIKFKNFETSEELRFLLGAKLFVKAKDKVILKANEFFIHDLLGSKVIKGDKFFGIIEDVLCLPANDVYVIKDENDKEILIPAVKAYIKGFDAKSKILSLTEQCDIFENDEN